MIYSKNYLDILSNPNQAKMDETAKTIKTLLDKMHSDCNSLTLYERDWICNKLQILHSSDDIRLDPYDFPCCKDSIFYVRYLCYFDNVEGSYVALDWTDEIRGFEKERDIKMLEESYIEWIQVIEKGNHSDQLLQSIASETRSQVKDVKKFCKEMGFGFNREKYLVKSLILHSKFVFRYVQSYYEECPKKEIVEIDGKITYVDSFFYTHTMFRHYGKIIKDHQSNKSYHIPGFDYMNLPKEVLNILKSYKMISSGFFDGEIIYFHLSAKIYAIYFRQFILNIKGGGRKCEYRVQTLYPVEDANEIGKIKLKYSNEVESNGVVFLMN